MCGGAAEAGEDCPPCGGLGCVREDEAPQCGGEGCSGLATVSKTVLKSAQDLDQKIQEAMQDVDKLSRMVSGHFKLLEAALNRVDASKCTDLFVVRCGMPASAQMRRRPKPWR